MSDMSLREYTRIINKQRNLPSQLERARRRVQQLEQEARRLGVIEILNNPGTVDKAWERELELAKLRNTEGQR